MISLLRTRRSIRQYKERPIEKEKIEILKEALVRSPTSRNFMPWEFFFVEDKDMLDKLSQAKPHGAGFLKNAALGIVICGDETTSDVWVEDCSIAAILVQMTAQSLGLGSCWIQIRKREYTKDISSEEYLQELMNLSVNIKIECIISLGYPAEKKDGIPEDQLNFKKIKP